MEEVIPLFASFRDYLAKAHSLTAMPALIIFYVLTLLVFLAIGIFSIDNTQSGYGKFLLIWFISAIVLGAILIFLIMSPNFVFFFRNIFS